MSNRINIKEFAKELGLSTATISRAFGAKGRISEKTKKRILIAAEEMGYYANFHASNLASKNKGNICFFYPELYSEEPDFFVNELILGINRALSNQIMLKVTPFEENNSPIFNSCKQQFYDGRVDAAIILGGTEEANSLVKIANQQKIPYVFIGKNCNFDYNSVYYSNEHGGFLAGKYFQDTKRKKIAYVTGHLDYDKQVGFARGFGIDLSELIIVEGGAGFRYGVQAVDCIIKNHPDVDAILCANDILAIGVIKRAMGLGKKIPKDLAVIGFDDVAIAKYYHPEISTVSLNLKQMGVSAVNLIEKQFKTKQNVVNEFVQCNLIIREST